MWDRQSSSCHRWRGWRISSPEKISKRDARVPESPHRNHLEFGGIVNVSIIKFERSIIRRIPPRLCAQPNEGFVTTGGLNCGRFGLHSRDLVAPHPIQLPRHKDCCLSNQSCVGYACRSLCQTRVDHANRFHHEL